MAEATQYMFTYQEIVESLIKRQGIHEGQWMIHIELGLQATNLGPSEDQLVPAAIVGITKIGIQQAPKPNNLSVDAATVNPATG